MKTIIKILIAIGLLSSLFFINTNAGLVDIKSLKSMTQIKKVTIDKTGSGDIVKDIENTGFSLLKNIKVVLEGILLIYIVYAGASMILSMGSDDSKLTKSKTQLWYALIAIIFINVPGTIFDAIYKGGGKTINLDGNTYTDSGNSNILINLDLFNDGLFAKIISSIEVFIFIISVYIIIMAGIKIMTSRGKDEKITEAKGKMLYSFFALIFVGFIEAWKQFAVTGDMKLIGGETGIFGKMTDIALLFAGPTVMIFLTYAGYIYITSNGDEDKVKNAKSIIINTLIGIALLLVMVVFLNDLMTLGDNSKQLK